MSKLLGYIKLSYLAGITALCNLIGFDKAPQFMLSHFRDVVMWNGVLSIKVAQWLSNRDDLIPSTIANQLKTFEESCAFHSLIHTNQIMKQSFGKEISELFDDFDAIPIASGSIGQVHRAVYCGNNVAVKIKHPDVDAQVKTYFEILRDFSRWLPINIDSFESVITSQIDFDAEANNIRKFGELYADEKLLIVPRVYINSKDVIIMSYEDGEYFTDYCTHTTYEEQREIALILSCLDMKMTLIDNLIHGDLHRGNWRVSNGRIVLYDYGLVYSTKDIHSSRGVWNSLITRNMYSLIDSILLQYSTLDQFSANSGRIIDKCNNILLNDNMTDLLKTSQNILGIVREENITFDSCLVNIIINTCILEGYQRKYGIGDFDAADNIAKYTDVLKIFAEFTERTRSFPEVHRYVIECIDFMNVKVSIEQMISDLVSAIMMSGKIEHTKADIFKNLSALIFTLKYRNIYTTNDIIITIKELITIFVHPQAGPKNAAFIGSKLNNSDLFICRIAFLKKVDEDPLYCVKEVKEFINRSNRYIKYRGFNSNLN